MRLPNPARGDLWMGPIWLGLRMKDRSPLRGLRHGLGWGGYKQATPNGVSAEQSGLRHQLTFGIASADVGNDKR
jgi:hypothetical protein